MCKNKEMYYFLFLKKNELFDYENADELIINPFPISMKVMVNDI
jgi:hypothetical protein